MTTGPLTELLSRRPALVLDGAMGTELLRRGVDTGLPLWSARALMTHPEAVLQIHREYAEAGADILTANTFRTTPRTFRKAGFSERPLEGGSVGRASHSSRSPEDRSPAGRLTADTSEALTALAVALARKVADETAGRTVLVAGSIAPVEDCYRPDLVPSDEELQAEHELHAARLARAGVDFILLETMGTIREAVIALAAARETGNEVIVSFICKEDGRLFGGEPLGDGVRAVARLKPTMLALNCVPVNQVDAAIDALKAAWPGPWAVYANAGRPEDLDSGVITTVVSPDEYAVYAKRWLSAGARIVGGCCGTTPEHISAVRSLLQLRGRT
jgi:S-methylmethionine-dependent homocysteine/selenocysteine methylase